MNKTLIFNLPVFNVRAEFTKAEKEVVLHVALVSLRTASMRPELVESISRDDANTWLRNSRYLLVDRTSEMSRDDLLHLCNQKNLWFGSNVYMDSLSPTDWLNGQIAAINGNTVVVIPGVSHNRYFSLYHRPEEYIDLRPEQKILAFKGDFPSFNFRTELNNG